MTQTLGRHVLAEYHGGEAEKLDDVAYVEAQLLEAARCAGATVIGAMFHHFAPWGVSGVVVIQESHLTIHTWPEVGYAAVDLFTCGASVDPWVAHRHLSEAFGAAHSSAIELRRGQYDLSPPAEGTAAPGPPPRIEREAWFTARQGAWALSLRLQGTRLHHEHSPYQRIEVYHSEAYGKFLALDGQLVVAEQDERPYHELLVHVPLQLLAQPRRVLVIGGGDGGAVRECLRYPHLVGIDVVEWDQAVPRVAAAYLPELARGLQAAPVRVHTAEGLAWLESQMPTPYDLIIFDLPGHWTDLDTAELRRHWRAAAQHLAPGGLLLVSGEAPRFHADSYRRLRQSLAWPGHAVHPCLITWPTYPGSLWSLFLLLPANQDPLQPLAQPPEGLHVYNHALHRASFALPNDLR